MLCHRDGLHRLWPSVNRSGSDRRPQRQRDVVTAADVPGQLDIGAVFPGDPLLAAEVGFDRQPMFSVAATSLRLAQQAARLARLEPRIWRVCTRWMKPTRRRLKCPVASGV